MFKKRIYVLSITAGLLFGALSDIYALGDTPSVSAAADNNITDAQSLQTEENKMSFADVSQDSWYYPYVEYLVEHSVVKGMTETQFAPEGTFTVTEAAAIITRYLGLEKQASDRKYAMEILSVQGSEKWYSGYLQVMYEAGIIDVEKYGCTIQGRHISIDDPSLLEAPVKRYEFAAFVTRSFELQETEIGEREDGSYIGSEFIWNGGYDESMLEEYIPFINDYAQIPSEYNYYVLKAYYNGLFIGDDNGNFNPYNNLTRAEMAKVTAAVMDFSLRLHIDLTQQKPSYDLPEDSFLQVGESKYLKNSVSDSILSKESSGVKTFYMNNMPYVAYTQQETLPSGLKIEIYHFTRDKSGFDINIASGIYSDGAYQNVFTAGDRLLLVLVDSYTGEPVDALDYTLVGVDYVSVDECRYVS